VTAAQPVGVKKKEKGRGWIEFCSESGGVWRDYERCGVLC
jgi:hypothetical protein